MSDTTPAPPLGVAVIGLGLMGVRRCQAVRQSRGLRLALVVDQSEAIARSAGHRYGCEWATDLDAILSHAVDLVIICTPTAFHRGAAVWCLHHELHVLVEKPLAGDLASADEIVNAVPRGRHLKVGFHYPYLAPVRAAIALRDAGAIGAPFLASATVGHSHLLYDDGPRSAGLLTHGGGPMRDLGIHAADLGRMLLGDPEFDSATGTQPRGGVPPFPSLARTDSAGPPVAVTGIFRFAGGQTLELCASYADHQPFMRLDLEVSGLHGNLRVNSGAGRAELRTNGVGAGQFPPERIRSVVEAAGVATVRGITAAPLGSKREPPNVVLTRLEFEPAEPDSWWAAELDDFCRVIQVGTWGRLYRNGEDGLKAQEMVEAAVRSAEADGQPVRLADLRGAPCGGEGAARWPEAVGV